jgi:hypothetical protein
MQAANSASLRALICRLSARFPRLGRLAAASLGGNSIAESAFFIGAALPFSGPCAYAGDDVIL